MKTAMRLLPMKQFERIGERTDDVFESERVEELRSSSHGALSAAAFRFTEIAALFVNTIITVRRLSCSLLRRDASAQEGIRKGGMAEPSTTESID